MREKMPRIKRLAQQGIFLGKPLLFNVLCGDRPFSSQNAAAVRVGPTIMMPSIRA